MVKRRRSRSRGAEGEEQEQVAAHPACAKCGRVEAESLTAHASIKPYLCRYCVHPLATLLVGRATVRESTDGRSTQGQSEDDQTREELRRSSSPGRFDSAIFRLTPTVGMPAQPLPSPTMIDTPGASGHPLLFPSRDPQQSFYDTRDIALTHRCYGMLSKRPEQPYSIVAVDVASGSGAKKFNVMPRSSLLGYLVDVLPEHRRNLYIVTDPAVAMDPFFDIDLNLAADDANKDAYGALQRSRREQEDLLAIILAAIFAALPHAPKHVAVFDCCRADKLSFHVHMRFGDGVGIAIKAIGACAAAAKKLLVANGEMLAAQAIDPGVYNQWQTLRLPYSSKRLTHGRNGLPFLPLQGPLCSQSLSDLLFPLRPPSAETAFDMALITRPDLGPAPALTADEAKQTNTTSHPFSSGPRVVLSGYAVHQIVQLLRLLDPKNFSSISHVHASMDTGNVRTIYVTQKCSRYCPRARREHKSTHGVFHLYYGSIKFRCYSNDCTTHPLHSWPWPEEALPIRGFLFPELQPDQLVSRYPAELLSDDVKKSANSILGASRDASPAPAPQSGADGASGFDPEEDSLLAELQAA